jgi:hypothetical protein
MTEPTFEQLQRAVADERIPIAYRSGRVGGSREAGLQRSEGRDG